MHKKPSESFLPDFCALPAVFGLVLSSLLLAFVLSLANFISGRDFWTDLGLRSLFITWVALLSGAVLCAVRSRLARLDAIRGGLMTFAVVQCATLVVGVCAQYTLARYGIAAAASGSALYYLRILAVSSLVTAAWLRYLYVQSRWRAHIKAEGEARLDALQARMRPHFLFNSLNTIASLTRKSPGQAEELLLDLAELFRAVLKKDAKLVSLADEVGLTRQYLNIEQQRLGARLEVLWSIDEVPQDALIPPLSLQPLVENAIYHGIEPSQRGGRLHVLGQISKKGLLLTVRNTLPEADARRARQGTREAVANLRARLEVCFPGRAQLLTSLVDDYYQVRIVIPYLSAQHENSHR